MNTHTNKIQKTGKHDVSNYNSNKISEKKSVFKIDDNRTEAVTQRLLQKMANNGVQTQKAVQLHSITNNRLINSIQKKKNEEEELAQGKFITIQKHGMEEEELLQGKFQTSQRKEIAEEEPIQGKFITVQRQDIEEEELLQGKFNTIQKKENNTGLPDNLKSGIENLSGISMDDVKVHYNSNKPATLQAHAYAQGTDIHVSPGQEKHVPHEAWHVVQQKQGRVKPTMQLKDNVNVNDDKGLEKEADVMGEKASSVKLLKEQVSPFLPSENISSNIQVSALKSGGDAIQRILNVNNAIIANDISDVTIKKAPVFKLWGLGNDTLIVKYERFMQAADFQNNNAYGKERERAIYDLASNSLKRVPNSVRLTVLEIQELKNLLNATQDGGMLKNLANDYINNNAPPGVFIKMPEVDVGESLGALIDAANAERSTAAPEAGPNRSKVRNIILDAKKLNHLGRIAAFDLLVGNTDRFRADGNTNYDNLDFSSDKGKTLPIDNFDPNGPIEDTPIWLANQGAILTNDQAMQNWAVLVIQNLFAASGEFLVETYQKQRLLKGPKTKEVSKSRQWSDIMDQRAKNLAYDFYTGMLLSLTLMKTKRLHLHGQATAVGASAETREIKGRLAARLAQLP